MHSTLWLLFKGQELLVKTDDLAFPLLPHHSLAHLLEAQAHHVTVYQQQPGPSAPVCRWSWLSFSAFALIVDLCQ